MCMYRGPLIHTYLSRVPRQTPSRPLRGVYWFVLVYHHPTAYPCPCHADHSPPHYVQATATPTWHCPGRVRTLDLGRTSYPCRAQRTPPHKSGTAYPAPLGFGDMSQVGGGLCRGLFTHHYASLTVPWCRACSPHLGHPCPNRCPLSCRCHGSNGHPKPPTHR